ncbi:MAG TPA: hypothetical protein VL048_05900 [Xanthobacteraceae bacterium]|nr:hypothetical protein [Xanthobacteraceae bacterium]
MSADQARDSHGRFAGGAEAQARNSGRNPVAAHAGNQSVGTHVSASGDFTRDARGHEPTSGYQVAGAGGKYMGQWTDPRTGKVYRERSQNVQSLALAKSMGRRLNQIAIWDNKNHREIATHGTGE